MSDLLKGLSPAMLEELGRHLDPRPNSVHEEELHPERWVRMAKKSTVDALERRDLVYRRFQDFPCGGYKGELTEKGMAIRAELLNDEMHPPCEHDTAPFGSQTPEMCGERSTHVVKDNATLNPIKTKRMCARHSENYTRGWIVTLIGDES